MADAPPQPGSHLYTTQQPNNIALTDLNTQRVAVGVVVVVGGVVGGVVVDAHQAQVGVASAAHRAVAPLDVPLAAAAHGPLAGGGALGARGGLH